MIEVITYAQCRLRVPAEENYRQYIEDELNRLDGEIVTEQIVSIDKPARNQTTWSLESRVLARFILHMPEQNPAKKVDEYIEHVVPFLKRHVPKCNHIDSTRIIQLKRALNLE
ncbi:MULTISPECIES: hypothetical protein [Paenibacillus]|uniref:Uncharacterized protein n=1 Tax=Paenibacillus campinasensis TaxID=66347 RepID=A0ABW9SZS3_9BACL|nr:MULTISPECIES: hypothetical protein [Paenibacillus]MUG66172.1 hypothetical protein [Paenibacillus campinasensis]PAK49428.1 hypothetical protein CHH75_20925 [Paenibacillus sp. 7541]